MSHCDNCKSEKTKGRRIEICSDCRFEVRQQRKSAEKEVLEQAREARVMEGNFLDGIVFNPNNPRHQANIRNALLARGQENIIADTEQEQINEKSLRELKNQIDDVKTQLPQIKNQVNQTQSDLTELKTETKSNLNQLKDGQEQQENKIKIVENEVEELTNKVDNLKTRQQDTQNQVNQLEARLTTWEKT
ncbi:3934_t:CDS:2 [Gigaspora margarita]|uniref:3934_t:CDS:1 n=1 Tax=Gigaspora margarita TaxID=4874 RepID=A0ABN7VFL0_GIGMA|nr:3934_t:CDS:2 [Gigaspora margarita]